jgi:RNA polymerase sigma-70 factor, ECF subfamily
MGQSKDDAKGRELLAKIGRQDERALQEFHGSYARRIYAFAVKRLRNADEAETVVSDTLFEVWKHPDRFRGESLVSTWLFGIAKNKLLMMLRARDPEHEELSEAIPAGGLGSFEIFAKKELRQGILRCMEGLSGVQRECLHLTLFEGLSQREVAAIQQCLEETVKTRLFHARKNIRDCLRKLLDLLD